MRRAEGLRLPSTTRGAGPGLLLVHGVGATAQSTYGPILPALAQRFTVVSPDYSKCRDVRELDALVDGHVGSAESAGQERFAVVAHSFGVPIALRLAVRYPERVTGLVLTAGFASAPPTTRLKMHAWRRLVADCASLLPTFLMAVMFSDSYLLGMSEEQRAGMAELIGENVDDGAAAQMELVMAVDLHAELDQVAAPTLVVATTADQLVSPSASDELLAAIPRARLAELDCGHLPGLERADDWARLIGDFVGSVVSPEPAVTGPGLGGPRPARRA
jgi:pimeloyl-ACP methyl ester carboxylesterase